MPQDPSPLDTLRQLKEWLDAGTITPQEFATLKQKLLFSPDATPPAEPAAATLPPVAPHVVAAPVEMPGLPAFVDEAPATETAGPPAPELPPPPATPAQPFAHALEVGRPGTLGTAEPVVTVPPAATNHYAASYDAAEEEAPVMPTRNPLMLVLLIGGILALLGLIAYLAMGNRESERLSSTTLTAADSLAVQPEEGPQTEQIELPPAAAIETVRVVPALPPAAAITDSAAPVAAPAPAETSAPAAATPAAGTSDEAARTQAQQALLGYYSDLKAAPFDAAAHFAPQVERFYTQQNTTPATIEAELTKTHFPEFLDAETTIEPGTLQVGPQAEDGTRVVTFREKSRAFRQSRQQHQQTTAQVRVRLDRNFKIVYLRQERLLENVFSE